MRKPSEAEARWIRSVRAGDISYYFPRLASRIDAYYRDGTLKAKDRGVLTRMRQKGWLTHDYNPDDPSAHKVTLTAVGREAFEKIGSSRV